MSVGEMNSKDGLHYVGEFKKSRYHGDGKMNYSSNKEYDGQWKDGNSHGKGKLTFLKDYEEHEKGTVYKGTYKNGEPHGIFEIIFPDGDILDATYVDGKQTKHKWRN